MLAFLGLEKLSTRTGSEVFSFLVIGSSGNASLDYEAKELMPACSSSVASEDLL